jgi:hypothetical protein
MIEEGQIEQALSIVRGVHERYDGAKHNPWNEIECGDHYARALASWACLTAVSGYQYDGPAGRLSFDPKMTPEDFKCAFTTAEGWGTYEQGKNGSKVRVKWGRVPLKILGVPGRDGKVAVTLNGRGVDADGVASHNSWALRFNDLTLSAGDELVVSFA